MAILQLRRYQKRDADLDAVAASGVASAWTTYTPTVTAGTGTFTTLGTVTGRYLLMGKITFIRVDISITTNGTAATTVKATLPTTPAALYVINGRENNVNGAMLQGFAFTDLTIAKYDGTYPGGSGFRLILSGMYEST